MTNLEVLWTIGSVVAIISLSITVFMWLRIGPQQITSFLVTRRRRILFVTYITLLSAFTIFYISLFAYITVVLSLFSFQWTLLWVILAFSTVGLWSPVLRSQRVWGGRLGRVVGRVMLALGITILVGFWIASWSTDLLTPSILTGVVVVAPTALYLYRHWSGIKAKTVQGWGSVKTKTMQYWNRIGARIKRRSSS